VNFKDKHMGIRQLLAENFKDKHMAIISSEL
jgi:hypothetical protein